MKINKLALASMIVFAVFLQSCRKGGMWGIKGEGDNVSEVKNLTGFSGLDLRIHANVQYMQDSAYSVEINAQKNILAILESKVEGGQLIFDFRRDVWEHNSINIIVHSPTMNKINISGSGNIDVQNKIVSNGLDLTISGSGNISIPTVSLQTLNAKISGSGNVTVNSGTCSSEYYNISGSGNIYSEYLTSMNSDVKCSGSGNITLQASNNLNVNISGSGSVSYRGKPTVNVNISGTGRLIHLD